jgi:hypothetical protein
VALAGGAWRSAVSVREAPELARRLIAQMPPEGTPRAASVTDLVALRRAYWRVVRPVPFDATRQARLDLGRSMHRRLGLALATEGQLEVRIRRSGVVGRIDVLSDVPVEVKTSSSRVASDDLTSSRPEQIEQLAMYCALSARPVGRLLTVTVRDGEVLSAHAADARFRDLDAVRAEMRVRAEHLQRARSAQRPTELPACRWFGRGCEFEDANVCDCTENNPPAGGGILDEVVETRDREDIGQRVEARLKEVGPLPVAPGVERFRELLYPRRGYFDRRRPTEAPERPPSDPLAPMDLYWSVLAALESGPVGEMSQLPSPTGDPAEDVLGFLGEPLLLKTSWSRDPATERSVLEAQPQYPLELGFRAAATGHDSGYVVLGRERAAREADRIQVFHFRFAPATAFRHEWEARARALAAAELGAAPGGLPPCPDWMYSDCPYRSECGCGATGARSQR